MKKTLAVAAVLAAFAGTAAADVSIYGRLDYGMQYTHTDGSAVDAADDWGVEAGGYTTSRLGIKAVEQVSEGMKVGVVLETGMNGGKAFSNGFDRETRLFVETQYGTFSVGRMGILNSDANYSGIMMGIQNVQGSGSFSGGEGAGMFVKPSSRMDKMITYASPVMAGTQVWAQYAGGDNTSGEDRYAALGATYKAGAFQAGIVVDYLNKNSIEAATAGKYVLTDEGKAVRKGLVADVEAGKAGSEELLYAFDNTTALEKAQSNLTNAKPWWKFENAVEACQADVEDQITINVGANYDFGVAKVYGGAQYFKNAADFGTGTFANEDMAELDELQDVEGYGLTLSAAFPGVLGGTVKATATYIDGESDAAEADAKAWNVGVQYAYNLSKRTVLYTGVGYTEEEVKTATAKHEADTLKVSAGIAHYF